MTDTADMTTAADLTSFKMTPRAEIGSFEIELNGERVEDRISAVHIEARARTIPIVSIELSAHADAGLRPAFEGLARVQVLEPMDPGPAAAVFLGAIDAGELEKAALNSPNLSNEPHALTAEMLRLLTEWAHGRS